MIQSTKPRGCQRSRERHPDCDVGLQHFSREQLTRLAQPRRVVRQEGVVDEIRDALAAVYGTRRDGFAAEEAALFACGVLVPGFFSFFRGTFLLAFRTGSGCPLAVPRRLEASARTPLLPPSAFLLPFLHILSDRARGDEYCWLFCASITICAASLGSSVMRMRSMSPGEIFCSPSTRD
jgi:hypothetical protein